MTKENKPEIRFSGFSDAWEQRKLSEFADKAVDNRGKTPPLDNNGNHPLIEVASLGGVHPDYSKIEKYLNDESFKNNLRSYIKHGDILFSTVGSIGLVSLMDTKEEAAIAQNIVAFRAKKNFVPEYLYALFSNEDNQNKALRIVMGAVQPSIKVSQLVNVEYTISQNIVEQKKIGAFFSNLDNTITLQQRKLEILKNQKKAFLEKMFPKEGENIPEIRFPEFSDAWKQCKLSDLVNVVDGDRGKNYPTEADFEPHGHTLFLNASNVTIDGFLFDTNQFITEEKSNSMGSGKIIKDDIIITSRGSLGHIAWYNDSVQQVMPHLRINSGMLILRNKANVKTSYLHQFMKSDKGKAQIVFMSFGSAQPQLTKKGVESFTVNYPIDTEEQIKIGAFFSKLDNTITLQQRKLEILKNIKKSFLQKMFV